MLSKLTFKVKLQYFSEDKKIVFYNEMSSDGFLTTTVSLGNDRVTE